MYPLKEKANATVYILLTMYVLNFSMSESEKVMLIEISFYETFTYF